MKTFDMLHKTWAFLVLTISYFLVLVMTKLSKEEEISQIVSGIFLRSPLANRLAFVLTDNPFCHLVCRQHLGVKFYSCRCHLTWFEIFASLMILTLSIDAALVIHLIWFLLLHSMVGESGQVTDCLVISSQHWTMLML